MKYFSFILLIVIVGVIFRSTLTLSTLTGGDWGFYFPETIRDFPLIPSTWNNWFGDGFGGNQSFFMNINSYFNSTTSFFHNILSIPWLVIERVFWFWPFILLSTISAYFLFITVFPDKKYRTCAFVSSLIYLCNTYALMIIGGGQMGVVMSYALVPLTFALFIRVFQSVTKPHILSRSIIYSLILSVQIMFDVRIAYIALSICILYFLFASFFNFPNKAIIIKQVVYTFVFPGIIAILLHLWWILPYIHSSKSPIEPLGDLYTNVDSVYFFSFAHFSNALSFLHPNWPENLFGKVYFLRPEFMGIPLLAFISLLFLKRKMVEMKKKIGEVLTITFFSFLVVIGVFLAKGANEPFGNIYIFLFEQIPGFFMFRDPTKFYAVIAVTYSILIPFSLYKLCEWIKHQHTCTILHFKFQTNTNNNIFNLQTSFVVLMLVYLLIVLYPAFSGQLKGTFQPKPVPREYTQLKDVLVKDTSFGRVLWIPYRNRFGFYDDIHPAINASELFETDKLQGIVKRLDNPDTISFFQNAGVEYIVVPSDPYGEIFLEDRQYSEQKNSEFRETISSIGFISKHVTLGDMDVYHISGSKGHIYSLDGGALHVQNLHPTEYNVSSKDNELTTIVFNESFDRDWVFDTGSEIIRSKEYKGEFNQFDIPKTQTGTIRFLPQQYVPVGLGIAFITLAGSIVLIAIDRNRSGEVISQR